MPATFAPSDTETLAANSQPALPAPVADKLRSVFGFDTLRPGQAEVVRSLLEDRSALAIFPTGGGKSLCYQLPALVLDGVTLVISPLIALMKDQLDFLASRGVPAARLDSSLTREENFRVFDDLHAGRTKLLYVSPERLGNERFLTVLRKMKISLLAVDEAHCISQWGHNFRPDYLRIASLAAGLKVPRVLALTATATPEVTHDIAEAFLIEPQDIVNTGFYRPNLHLHAGPVEGDRKQTLVKRLKAQPSGPAIVYVTLQKTAEQVAAYLASAGLNATAYHAGMKTEKRTEIQEAFMASNDMIVVATIAFGMGIDKADIRAVYHYNLPKGLESYMQEIGRAGRDGEVAHCEMLASAEDVITLENFSYGDTPTPEAIAGLVEEVFASEAVAEEAPAAGSPSGGSGENSQAIELAVYELSARHDVRDLVVKTLLTYLELEGILQPMGAIYSQYKFKPQRPSKEILGQFDADRARFVGEMFRHAQRGGAWITIDVAHAAQVMRQPRSRLVAALEYLDQRGDLILQTAGVRQRYRLLQQTPQRSELVASLVEKFQQREDQDIARIHSVLDLAEAPGCLTRSLLAYFGEERDLDGENGGCGHCDRCLGTAPSPLPRVTVALQDSDRQTIARVARERHLALASPRQLTRFLCGVSSPATSKAKLRQHQDFGKLEAVPFGDVLAACAEYFT